MSRRYSLGKMPLGVVLKARDSVLGACGLNTTEEPRPVGRQMAGGSGTRRRRRKAPLPSHERVRHPAGGLAVIPATPER